MIMIAFHYALQLAKVFFIAACNFICLFPQGKHVHIFDNT